jgi:DNA-binding MarR family transcriptional regulator
MSILPPRRPSALESRALRVIGRLRAMRAFERRHLHHLRTLEDRDLICEIGYHQGERRPLTLSQIYRLGLGSVATVQRRLRRLRHEGCIRQTRSTRDRRTLEFTLSPKLLQVFDQYAALLAAP